VSAPTRGRRPTAAPATAGEIFALVRQGAVATRTEIGRATGLSRTAVAARVDRLLAEGLITEVQGGAVTGGRPAARLAFHAAGGTVLAASVGVSRTSLAVCDLAGNVLAQDSLRIRTRSGPESVMTAVADRLAALIGAAGVDPAAVRGIGLSIPGTVDSVAGCSIGVPVLPGWAEVKLPPLLAGHFPVPVRVDNDVNVMAIAEQHAHPGIDDLLVLKVSTGIGAAVVRRLAADGARVAVLDLDPSGAPEGSLAVTADVTDEAGVRAAVERVLAEWDRIDVLVNNAGVGAQGTVEDNTDDEWHRVFDVNVLGMVRTARAALPALRRSPSAAIVNTGSIAATAGLPQRALYSATKGAVLALTRAMAADHLAEGIRVNCVHPGTADTPWIGRLLDRADDPAAERAALEARQPHGRLVSAEEVADAIAYLADPRSRSTTGTGISVDGGMQELRLRPRQS